MKWVWQITLCLNCYCMVGQNYLTYHQSLKQARAHIAEGNFQTGLDLYRATFEAFDFQFARDCVHAAEVAAHVQDHQWLATYIECALRRGVPWSYFAEDARYEGFQSTPYWTELHGRANSLRENYLASIDQHLRGEIENMFASDQALRARYYRWYNFLWRPLLGRQWKKLNEKQVFRLVEITREGGFPGEKRIGLDPVSLGPGSEPDRLSAGRPIVILLHHYSRAQPSHDSLFRSQVIAGNMSHRHYATICDFEVAYGMEKYPTDGPYGERFLKDKLDDGTLAKREKLGLDHQDVLEVLSRQGILTKFWVWLY